MTPLGMLATFVGVFLGLANLPQAFKVFQRKSADDLSLTTYLIFLVGSVIWILYGLEIKSIPVIIPNSLGLVSTCIVLWGYYLYGGTKKKKKR